MPAAGWADSVACTLPALPTPSAGTTPASEFALGGVRWQEAPGIADSVITGTAVLHAADSLGAPLIRVWYGGGDLRLGGSGSGILLVNGNLDMLPAFEFDGVVVVRGIAVMAADARITGSLWVQQPGASPPAGQLVYSRCGTARALLESPGARRPIPAQRRFIPAF
jgi:hypothetical protein